MNPFVVGDQMLLDWHEKMRSKPKFTLVGSQKKHYMCECGPCVGVGRTFEEAMQNMNKDFERHVLRIVGADEEVRFNHKGVMIVTKTIPMPKTRIQKLKDFFK